MTTLCPRIFHRKNVAIPQKTTYLKRLAYIWSGQRMGTSRESPAALIIMKIMFLLRFLGYYCQKCQASRTFPCTAIFCCSPVEPILRKSGKAIREIAFENAGKNSIANSSAATTAARTCWDYLAGPHLKNILFSKIMSCAPGSFVGRMFLSLKKPHIWKDRLRNGLVKKKGHLKSRRQRL